jgi:L-amino acid N-acyltransferase YncA
MDIRLAPIAPEDRQSVMDLFNHYVRYGFAAFPETPLPYAFFDKFLEAARGYPTVTAKAPDGRLLGFALLRPHAPWPTCSHAAEITYFIAEESTRQGIGSRMLAELEALGKKHGVRTILASISALNDRSLAFHRKHGFTEVGRFRQICIKNATPFDTVWMQKML